MSVLETEDHRFESDTSDQFCIVECSLVVVLMMLLFDVKTALIVSQAMNPGRVEFRGFCRLKLVFLKKENLINKMKK